MSTRTDFTYAAYLDDDRSNAGYDGFVQWLHLEYGKRIDELEHHVDQMDLTLNSAVEFLAAGDPTENDAIYVRKCFGYKLLKQPMWKVTQGSLVVGKHGFWTIEPQPSSRDEEFYRVFRFDTFGEAMIAAKDAYLVNRDIQSAREAARA